VKVLIVEDSRSSAMLLSQLLRKEGYEPRVAETLAQALPLAVEGWADIVLLDRELPDGDGLELCRQLKADARTRHLPVAFITSRQDESSVALALNSGALDYVSKPFRPLELLARVGVLARVKRAEDEVRRLTHRDPLTGLHNRRFLDERLPEEIGRARRSQRPLSCFVADVDRFKQINDQFGHPFGDRALVAVSRLLEQAFRSTDLIVRLGGDEFVGILPDTDPRGATVSVKRMLERARALSIEGAEGVCQLSLSVGVSAFQDGGADAPAEAGALLTEADRCLYKAKHAGRDGVYAHEPA
jgi:two-component system, cell cycle response regulator